MVSGDARWQQLKYATAVYSKVRRGVISGGSRRQNEEEHSNALGRSGLHDMRPQIACFSSREPCSK